MTSDRVYRSALTPEQARTELVRGAGTLDLAIVDLMTPGLPGDALIKEIRRIPGHEQLPILLLSASASKGFCKRQRSCVLARMIS